MARLERKHEILSEPLTDAWVRSRSAEGWQPVAVVWERQVEGAAEACTRRHVPFGLRIADDCQHLEEDRTEVDAMVLMLRLIISEQPFSAIAVQLNDKGFRTRQGTAWNQTSVFHMLPRLIEVAPSIYSSSEWMALRPRLQTAM